MSDPAVETPTPKPPKTPQDRQPKKAKTKKPVDQVKTITLDGHDYRIDPDVFNDLRFLELYEDEKWIGVLRHMLGPEQLRQFYENHASKNGRVTGEKFTQIMEEFQASDMKVELGNS